MDPLPLIAEVAVAAPLDRTLSYHLPESLAGSARIGMRLEVPLGRRRATGYLLGLERGEVQGLKAVREVLDEAPLFPAELVPFFRRIAEYYCHPLGEVIRTALPAGLSGATDRTRILRERVYLPAGEGNPAGAVQREVLAFIRREGRTTMSELREHFKAPHAPLRRLVELGLLTETQEERLRDPFLGRDITPDVPAAPTPEQETALAAIVETLDRGAFSPLLLHGVTGSGKTEVYLQSIAEVLDRNRQALVLVPEIALTPQLVGRFRARFAATASIAVLHSGLSDGERYDAWRSIARGEAQIVIGARSAIFAPLPAVGIIVVDEEHEASYKQSEGFRYHARDLALLRGQMAEATVLLGSATPALTTFFRAREGQTGYLCLGARVADRSMPEVTLVDLTEERPEGVLAGPLLSALGENIDRGEQALLLLNRRGFAPYLLCADCGRTFRCPNCEITLTYHQRERRLRCHYCDYGDRPPELCPGCEGGNIEPQGAGTERLEEELTGHFPGASIARMDRDTTTGKGAHQRLVENMERGEIDILVGTQMVAKGLDFPGVTLVGVVNADSTLNFPDFRSAERTFALLAQVAGRAGRGDRPGRVIIQTYSPDHYALTCVAAHDYQGFFDQEIAGREALGYPPFGFLVNLVLAGNDAAKVSRTAALLAERLEEVAGEAEVLGPAPCPLGRLRGKTRQQILLKAAIRPPLRRLLAFLPDLRQVIPSGVRLAVDVDPIDML